MNPFLVAALSIAGFEGGRRLVNYVAEPYRKPQRSLIEVDRNTVAIVPKDERRYWERQVKDAHRNATALTTRSLPVANWDEHFSLTRALPARTTPSKSTVPSVFKDYPEAAKVLGYTPDDDLGPLDKRTDAEKERDEAERRAHLRIAARMRKVMKAMEEADKASSEERIAALSEELEEKAMAVIEASFPSSTKEKKVEKKAANA
jgi:hypothetical protein